MCFDLEWERVDGSHGDELAATWARLATRWWSLLYEAQGPSREEYEHRHLLRFGREGFALPDLLIKPTGERGLIEWRALALPEARVGFSTSGTRDLELVSIRNSLADLIETVLARLDQQGVMDTDLHQEWQAIQATDEAEAAFCVAAAGSGQGPLRPVGAGGWRDTRCGEPVAC